MRTEHLLVILGEECCEVAQRASKALRFGLGEAQPGQAETNAARLLGEYAHIVAAVEMLTDAGAFDGTDRDAIVRRCGEKRAAVERFLRYSVECGTLTP